MPRSYIEPRHQHKNISRTQACKTVYIPRLVPSLKALTKINHLIVFASRLTDTGLALSQLILAQDADMALRQMSRTRLILDLRVLISVILPASTRQVLCCGNT